MVLFATRSLSLSLPLLPPWCYKSSFIYLNRGRTMDVGKTTREDEFAREILPPPLPLPNLIQSIRSEGLNERLENWYQLFFSLFSLFFSLCLGNTWRFLLTKHSRGWKKKRVRNVQQKNWKYFSFQQKKKTSSLPTLKNFLNKKKKNFRKT